MKISRHLIYLFIAILVLSCGRESEEQRYLKLRKKVLEHYKKDGNSSKEKAALFLLDNLKERYGMEGERVQVYSDTIKKYYKNGYELHEKLFPLRSISYKENKVRDIDKITAQYLTDHIDSSFAAFERAGWKDQVSFNDFCEYVLPYRIATEPLEDWRKGIINDTIFKIVGKKFCANKDLKSAATLFIRTLHRVSPRIRPKTGENSSNIPDLPYSILKLNSSGTCETISRMNFFPCRAAAIPITNDFTPVWANYPAGHDWPVVITKTGFLPFDYPVTDSLGAYKRPDRIPSKIYRNIFSENPDSHIKKRGYCKFLPQLINNPRIIDVTDLYMSTKDITIPVLSKIVEDEYAYLAVPRRSDWQPVGWGINNTGFANFKKIGFNSVYLPVFASEDGIIPLNYPFVVQENGKIRHFKPDLENFRKVEFFRKSPLSTPIRVSIRHMVGGKFQASNDKDFKNAVASFTIREYPDVYFKEVKINVSSKYRYVRYLGQDSSQCIIAELEFYENNSTKPLKGQVIGSNKNKQSLVNAFDGDVLTYNAESRIEPNQWVGLDLGKPVKISKIRFSARNDKNHIVEGNLYELFYWANSWKSLGKKTATGKVLVYDKAPSNCLFLLRNYTEGKEERIFSYENGKQVWW